MLIVTCGTKLGPLLTNWLKTLEIEKYLTSKSYCSTSTTILSDEVDLGNNYVNEI